MYEIDAKEKDRSPNDVDPRCRRAGYERTQRREVAESLPGRRGIAAGRLVQALIQQVGTKEPLDPDPPSSQHPTADEIKRDARQDGYECSRREHNQSFNTPTCRNAVEDVDQVKGCR